MAEENVELVQRFFEAWNDEDLDWIVEHLTPDFELTTIPGFDLDHIYRGTEGWRRFWDLWRDPWQSITARPERVEALDDGRVLAIVTFEGVGRESGVEVSLAVGQLWRLRDGFVWEVKASTPAEDAIEAAGLEA